MWQVQVFDDESDESDDDEYEYEVSVVHSSNKHGKESYGWDGPAKIILCNNQILSTTELQYWVAVANILCDGLNANNIKP